MDVLINLLSLDNIWHLDWLVKGPGIVIVGMLLWRAMRALFTMQPLTTITSLLYAMIITVVLSRFGFEIQSMIHAQLGLA